MGNKVLIIGAEDWEGLFVNGMLVDEGHTLNEGESRKKYLSGICKKYGVTLDEIKEGYVTDDYNDKLNDYGSFDLNLSDVGYETEEEEEE